MWQKKVLRRGLIVLLTLILARHLVFGRPSPGSTGNVTPSQPRVQVRQERSASGHKTIGIDESSVADNGVVPLLRFSSLQMWPYDPKTQLPCPPTILAFSGKRVKAMGFMYPLQTGKDIKCFCLLRTTQTCCYGPRPEFCQYVFIEMKKAVAFERLRPVIVTGRFFVDPKPDDGYIYRMEGESMETVADDTPDPNIDPAKAAPGLPQFPLELLETLQPKERTAGLPDFKQYPSFMTVLEGKQVVVSGYMVGFISNDPVRVIVGQYWFDGCCQGVFPNFFNSAVVTLRKNEIAPAPWSEKGVFVGRMEITRDKDQWRTEGLVSIKDAVRVMGVKPSSALAGDQPSLLSYLELLSVALFAMVFGWAPGRVFLLKRRFQAGLASEQVYVFRALSGRCTTGVHEDLVRDVLGEPGTVLSPDAGEDAAMMSSEEVWLYIYDVTHGDEMLKSVAPDHARWDSADEFTGKGICGALFRISDRKVIDVKVW